MEDVIDAEATEVVEDPPALARSTEVAVQATAMVAQGELSVAELVGQHDKIVAAMQGAMKEGVHYGTIPGVKKPSLFKPGAESLVVLFRLAPHYQSEKIWHDDGHLTVITNARLEHIPTGLTIATGEGLCTTREAKYAYRNAERLCPDCGQPQVRYGGPKNGRPGNWYCWAKHGGCGASWALDSDQAKLFEAMETGRMDNPDLADSYNTVLKMANKRALVAAVLNGTAASDVFTQDAEDQKRDAPAAEKVFDPETDLMEGAVKGAGAARAIADALAHLAPHVDLAETLDGLAHDVYGSTGSKTISRGDRPDWLRRLSNATAKLAEGGDFPPPSDEQIVSAFAFAFSGRVIELVLRDAETDSADEDGEAALDPSDPVEAQEASSGAAGVASDDIPFGHS